MLYTKQYVKQIQKLNIPLKNKININVYLFYVPNFQILIEIIYK